MKKVIPLILVLFILVGCTSQQELNDLKAENKRLLKENESLREETESLTIINTVNDTFDAHIEILEKLEVDGEYGWVIGQIGDLDHNTPVLFKVEQTLFEQITVGDEKTYHIYIRVSEMSEDSDEKYRYEFMILNSVE